MLIKSVDRGQFLVTKANTQNKKTEMENLLNPFTGMLVGTAVSIVILGLLALAIGGTYRFGGNNGPIISNGGRATIWGLIMLAGSFGHHQNEPMFVLVAFALMWGLVCLYGTILSVFKAERQWLIVIPLAIATFFTVSFFPKGTWGMYISVLCTCVGTLMFAYKKLARNVTADSLERLDRWATRFMVFGFTTYCGTAALLYPEAELVMQALLVLTAFAYLVFYQIIKKFDGPSLPFGIANAALAAVFILQSVGKLPLQLLSLFN
jgi:hypothetical protein